MDWGIKGLHCSIVPLSEKYTLMPILPDSTYSNRKKVSRHNYQKFA